MKFERTDTFDKCTQATSLILGVLYEFALEFSRKILASEIYSLKSAIILNESSKSYD